MAMEINDIIRKLDQLKLEEHPYEEVKSLLKQVGRIAYMQVCLRKGRSILRGRPNNDGEIFHRKADLSFKPQFLNKTYQRASTPNRTMFYGSILTENLDQNELKSARVIGVLEALPWLRDNVTSGYKKITFGRWEVESDLNVIAIIHNEEYRGKSDFSKELFDEYNNYLSKYEKDIAEKSHLFHHFLANEFSKDVTLEFDYLISAIFTELVTSDLKTPIDGILYPSMRVDGLGFNVALTPEACLKLGLYVVGECSIYKKKDKTVIGNDCVINLDGKIEEFELKELRDSKSREMCLKEIGVEKVEDLI